MARVRGPVKFIGFVIVALTVALVGKTLATKTSIGQKAVAAAKGTAAASQAVSEIDGVQALNVCVNTWGGYAGGQYFNNGFKADTSSRYWKEYHLPVNFIKIDDNSSIDAFKADKCQVHYGTVGSFTTLIAAMTGSDAASAPQIFFQPDWSNGGDVVVATAKVKSARDLLPSGSLARKGRIALWVGSPSHELLNDWLDAAGMTQNDVEVVSTPSALDVPKVLRAGEADVGILWSPDDQSLVTGADALPGAHVVFSTKQCASCIADIMVSKRSFIEQHGDQLKALVEGWLKGAVEIQRNPAAKDRAIQVLAAGLEQPDDFVRTAIDNARMTNFGDNVNFFNLKGGYTGVTGKSIYDRQGRKFRQLGLVEGALPEWSQVANTTVLRSVVQAGALASVEGQQATGPQKFAQAGHEVDTATAVATKGVTIEFPSGSAQLTDDAMIKIDSDIAQIVKSFSGARIRVEGNTDNVGPDAVNVPLSRRRANAVVSYLVNKYRYDKSRFIVVGNGARNPVDDNATNEGRQKNRRTDVQILNVQ